MAQQVSPKEMVDNLRPYFFPNIDLEMWERLTTYHYGSPSAITDHFRGTALLAQWAWAGAPFVVPGTIGLAGDSRLEVSNLAGNRAFLYQTTIVTLDEEYWASVALYALTVGIYVGIRLDDGTDNNYWEVVLRVAQASPTQWRVQGRSRTGGGAINTVAGDVMDAPLAYVLGLDPAANNAYWGNWAASPVLQTPLGLRGQMWKPNALPGGAYVAWTPTRTGLIFDMQATQSSWEKAIVDWVKVT